VVSTKKRVRLYRSNLGTYSGASNLELCAGRSLHDLYGLGILSAGLLEEILDVSNLLGLRDGE
jgi:hypothetical protein